MNNNEKSNRSVLALAGQRSLVENLSLKNISKVFPISSQLNQKAIISPSKEKQKEVISRKFMMKLTLPRLRKMQALVRGFLVRRKVYPLKLQEYLLAKSVLNVLISNVIYREASQVILQNITYLKYEPNYQQTMMGVQKMLQNQICDGILQRVFRKQVAIIVQAATAEYAKLLTRPKITYGFNLRDPLQLLLFDMVNNFVGMNFKQTVREAIQQYVNQNRELRIIDEWIEQYDLLRNLYGEIVSEALNQSIGEYIVDNMLNRMSSEGAEVIARVCYDEEVQKRKEKAYGELERKMIEWILQQASLAALKTSVFNK